MFEKLHRYNTYTPNSIYIFYKKRKERHIFIVFSLYYTYFRLPGRKFITYNYIILHRRRLSPHRPHHPRIRHCGPIGVKFWKSFLLVVYTIKQNYCPNSILTASAVPARQLWITQDKSFYIYRLSGRYTRSVVSILQTYNKNYFTRDITTKAVVITKKRNFRTVKKRKFTM